MELLKNAAKGVKDVTREWEEYKKAELEEELEAAAEESEVTIDHSESKNPEENMFTLDVLRNLTQSKDDLKALISSRLPYKSINHKFPSYGWKFFVERNVMIDSPFDESDELSSENSKPNNVRSRSESRSSNRQGKRRRSPAEIVERVSAPTYNSLTRNAIQIAALSVKTNNYYRTTLDTNLYFIYFKDNAAGKVITPECEVCKRRNVE